MGLLIEDEILSWDDYKDYILDFKISALKQFLDLLSKYKNNQSVPFYWGYEIEYTLVKKENNNFKINLIADKIINKINKINYLPEYGNWMLEKIPEKCFSDNINELFDLEFYIDNEKEQIKKYLDKDEYVLTLSNFPMFGIGSFYSNNYNNNFINYNCSKSIYLNDIIINPHIRFKTLTKNIISSRNEKIKIEIPIFNDVDTINQNIYMDAMGFGMGCCCSQVTFQTKNYYSALNLYDQFSVLSPILLALSSSTPIFLGKLSGYDSRWNIIEQSVDSRKKNSNINKSRFSSISNYVTKDGQKYNDLNIEYDQNLLNVINEYNIDSNLKNYLLDLFSNDPMILYKNDLKKINTNITNSYDFFLNINSSNWNNVRLKPPLNINDSWKVELRILELQLSSFENTAFFIFTNLLARVIDYYKLNLLIPISKLDENYKTAYKNDSINDKYYFKVNIDQSSKDDFIKMPIKNILSDIYFYIYKYLNEKHNDIKTKFSPYLDHIKKIADLKTPTNSQKIREFVTCHKHYNYDSVLNYKISNDLIQIILEKKI